MDFFSDPSFVLISASMLMGALHGVLFLQSAHDKLTDWKGNLGWLIGHFEKTPFKNLVPLLLGVITLFELISGIVAMVSIYFSLNGEMGVASFAAFLSLVTLLQLFTGQRIAKDYEGAGALVPYFLVSVLWLFVIVIFQIISLLNQVLS